MSALLMGEITLRLKTTKDLLSYSVERQVLKIYMLHLQIILTFVKMICKNERADAWGGGNPEYYYDILVRVTYFSQGNVLISWY